MTILKRQPEIDQDATDLCNGCYFYRDIEDGCEKTKHIRAAEKRSKRCCTDGFIYVEVRK